MDNKVKKQPEVIVRKSTKGVGNRSLDGMKKKCEVGVPAGKRLQEVFLRDSYR